MPIYTGPTLEYTTTDLGFNLSLVKGSLLGQSVTPEIQNVFSAGVTPANIISGELTESIVIASPGLIRSGQTDYNTGVGWWIGDDSGTPRFSIGDPDGDYFRWTGSAIESSAFISLTEGTFGGDGSDGALSITSGTTTLDMSNTQVYIRNYTSISITGTGSLAFSNPHANGTLIVLKSQGNVVGTSTATNLIDASGMGAVGGAAANPAGANGSQGTYILDDTDHFGVGGGAGSGGGGGVILLTLNFYTKFTFNLISKTIFLACGSGGGGGSTGQGTGRGGGGAGSYSAAGGAGATPTANGSNAGGNSAGGGGAASGGTGFGGAGGRGGAALLIECAGDLNFTQTLTVAGANGTDGTSGGNQGGGGGGGAAGMCLILYNTQTATSGTINTAGGAGGDSGASTGGTAGASDNILVALNTAFA